MLDFSYSSLTFRRKGGRGGGGGVYTQRNESDLSQNRIQNPVKHLESEYEHITGKVLNIAQRCS